MKLWHLIALVGGFLLVKRARGARVQTGDGSIEFGEVCDRRTGRCSTGGSYTIPVRGDDADDLM